MRPPAKEKECASSTLDFILKRFIFAPDLANMADPAAKEPSSAPTESLSFGQKLWRLLVGSPRNLTDPKLAHQLSLIPVLAWIGLGADGLSSSSYGPEEAFLSLGQHAYLAFFIAIAMAATVFIISLAYARIIEEFPRGGGGYVVATKLLGEKAGLVSGAALLVDYVLTITISIAAAGDAIFSLLPPEWHAAKLAFEVFLIVSLTVLNIRGVRESILTLAPVFFLFVITHVVLIAVGLLGHPQQWSTTAAAVGTGLDHGLSTVGTVGLLLALIHSYSLGGGTYTGIEAVSNGIPMMREPRVQTAKRTMLYMAVSLAFTASGLLLCYMLWNVTHVDGKTLNAVLAENITHGLPLGGLFVVLTLLSEGALLVAAAQAGFLGGPRVLANMAIDGWVPHRLSALSDRLTTQNGILLMGIAAMAALLYTQGSVRHLVVMYSINVFLTFSLSMLGMAMLWLRRPFRRRYWISKVSLFSLGFLLCSTILLITTYEKFSHGGWVTLTVTGSIVLLCLWIRTHYRKVGAALSQIKPQHAEVDVKPSKPVNPLDHSQPTAAVFVAAYHGLGIQTALNVFQTFPGYFKNLVFLSVGVLDSGAFKGEGAVEDLTHSVEKTLQKYVDLANFIGMPATYHMAIGTDVVEESEKLSRQVVQEFPRTTFFAGKIMFEEEHWYQKILHNETAFAIQNRILFSGQTMVVLPAKVDLAKT